MSNEELVIHAPLLSHVKNACTKKSYEQLQRLTGSEKEFFIARHLNAQVCPGEGVGIIASQSIGQPTTQIALSSFHSAGTTAVEVLEGIPRLESILNCSFKQATSTIHVTGEVSPLDFVYLTVLDMVSSYYIEHKPNSWWYPIAEKHGLYTAPVGRDRSAVFRMVINYKKMEDYRISLKMIRDKIIGSNDYNGSMQVFVSPEFEHIIDVLVQCGTTVKDMDMTIYRVIKSGVFPIKICGIRGIEHVVIDGTRAKTKGSNMMSTLGLDFVDTRLTVSDSAIDVLSCLGIEAARAVLVRELSKVLRGSIYLDDKHINLLADIMTSKGKIIPVNMSGMIERGHSYLTRASNERTIVELAKAACKGAQESTRGTSDSIITGTRSRVGTGMIDIIEHL